MWKDLPSDVRTGEVLYGNDFDDEQLLAWYADEELGFYELEKQGFSLQSEAGFDHKAMNRAHAKLLPTDRFDSCLAFGCGAGEDIKALGLNISEIVAIEPARQWWSDHIGATPATYMAPTPSGEIDLPSQSFDLIIALGALHHVANVETIINEFSRLLKVGGWLLIREPITSMGDFTEPRRGLTKRERGIPLALMRNFINKSDLGLRIHKPCSVSSFRKVMERLGAQAYNSSFLVRVDALLSAVLAPNAKYWRPRLRDKLAPSSAVYVAWKPNDVKH